MHLCLHILIEQVNQMQSPFVLLTYKCMPANMPLTTKQTLKWAKSSCNPLCWPV